MSDKNDNAKVPCSKSHCCKQEGEQESSWGESVAESAMADMDAEAEDKSELYAEAENFIKKCEERGRDPLRVAEWIVQNNDFGHKGEKSGNSGLEELVGTVVELLTEPTKESAAAAAPSSSATSGQIDGEDEFDVFRPCVRKAFFCAVFG